MVDPETLVLPGPRGYGQLKDLDAAMTLDPALRDMMKSFMLASATMTSAQLKEAPPPHQRISPHHAR